LRRCAGAGDRVLDLNYYDCATFRLPFVENRWRERLEEIKAESEKLSVVFSQAHGPFYNFCDPSFSQAGEWDALLYRAIDCCAELGASWLVIHAGTDFGAAFPLAASYRKNRTYFFPVLEYAAKRRVGIAFENLRESNIAPCGAIPLPRKNCWRWWIPLTHTILAFAGIRITQP
jgi:sugar phosphate isomerase/epimerase